MINPMMPIETGPTICQNRSLVTSECLCQKSNNKKVTRPEWTDRITKNDVVTLINEGGMQSKRVTVGLYPMVATMVGRKSPNDAPTSKKNPAVASHHTVQSLRAFTRPTCCALLCSILLRSSSILVRASSCSSVVSHEAGVVGKSGVM